ncbi:40S ribosomal protein S27-2-like [Zingiber officinale]|uniref:40S ribosomal protein S27-2-like n=1 Tax=Zingiber officinale TaxID=94328 RepID=UPI001C4DAC01|nr:40S ribosomal protein S27-2-like [Zingiber officinale]
MASLLNPSFFLPALPPFIHYICYSPCFSRFFLRSPAEMVLPNDIDLLNPPAELEKRRHKLKRLVQSPNSFFMDVKCQGCFNITTVFSHSQTVVVCGNCQTVLCQPTGGRARLTEGCSFRRKGD